MSEAVENLSISVFEKPITLRNTLPRKVIPTPEPTLAAKNPANIAAAVSSIATSSILSPDIQRYAVCFPSTSTPASLSISTA